MRGSMLGTVRTAVAFLCLAVVVGPVLAQNTSDRDKTREQLRATLADGSTLIGTSFRQSERNPYNFVGSYTRNLKNAQSLEIVISVTKSETIGFRVYPHYNGGYINTQKVQNNVALMSKLLSFTDQNFLFWGADETNDVFSGYTVTLESGYPEEAIRIVLRSIPNTDRFVGELRPFIDGSIAAQ
jgi:hypothetical protein